MRVLGIDLGGTHLRAATADARGALLSERCELSSAWNAPAFAARVGELAHELCPDGLAAAAVGLPGPVSSDGEVGHLVNAPELNDAPIRALLQEELAVPVVVENDVNLAALGERHRGRGRAMSDLAFIAVGTGVGMGVVASGKVVRGAHGGAGELGLLPLGPDRVATDPRALGPLEAVAGGAGLAARWAQVTGRRSDGQDVFAAAAAGNEAALALLEEQAAVLAMAVRAVQALFEPQLIVFGGGIGARHDVFARVQSALAAHGMPLPELELSALRDRAGVIGAIEAALEATRSEDAAAVAEPSPYE
jgi:glucokinase